MTLLAGYVVKCTDVMRFDLGRRLRRRTQWADRSPYEKFSGAWVVIELRDVGLVPWRPRAILHSHGRGRVLKDLPG